MRLSGLHPEIACTLFTNLDKSSAGKRCRSFQIYPLACEQNNSKRSQEWQIDLLIGRPDWTLWQALH
jgi:hypothetical protein